MPAKLWLVRDKGEVYALCSLCVMYRRLEVFVDQADPGGELAGVAAAQGGRCRAEIEDSPCCRSTPSATEGSGEAHQGDPDPSA